MKTMSKEGYEYAKDRMKIIRKKNTLTPGIIKDEILRAFFIAWKKANTPPKE